jgi:hypothetical protein
MITAPEVEEPPVSHGAPGECPEVVLARDHAARVLVEEVEVDVEADAPVAESLLPVVRQMAEAVPFRVRRPDDILGEPSGTAARHVPAMLVRRIGRFG